MKYVAFFLVLLTLSCRADTVAKHCTRHDTNDRKSRTYWDGLNTDGSTAICAEVYKVPLSSPEVWNAYRPVDNIMQSFSSFSLAATWVRGLEAQFAAPIPAVPTLSVPSSITP